MKNILSVLACFFSLAVFAQEKEAGRPIPAVDVKTSDGKTVNTNTFDNGGKPFVIDFWATWCKPCIQELDAINDQYEEWQKTTGVKVIIISLDDARTMQRVGPFINARGWTYESYIDPNADFKRLMNVNMPPQTFVVNGKKEIVWQHVGFTPGNEDELFEAVQKAAGDSSK